MSRSNENETRLVVSLISSKFGKTLTEMEASPGLTEQEEPVDGPDTVDIDMTEALFAAVRIAAIACEDLAATLRYPPEEILANIFDRL